jgi:hypothetical protein
MEKDTRVGERKEEGKEKGRKTRLTERKVE